jgi:hypothetical protein
MGISQTKLKSIRMKPRHPYTFSKIAKIDLLELSRPCVPVAKVIKPATNQRFDFAGALINSIPGGL